MYRNSFANVAVIFAILSGSTNAAVINGDFASGDLTGWSTSAIGTTLEPIESAPFINVVPTSHGSAVSFTTGSFSAGLFLASLEQEVEITAASPILSFDFTLPTFASDETGSPSPNAISDALFVLASSGANIFDLLLVDSLGASADPLGSAPGIVTLDAASTVDFDFTMKADLSTLAGQTVLLAFELVQEDDGSQISNLAVGNVTFVPEPSKFPISLAAIPLLFGRRRSARASKSNQRSAPR